MDNTEKFILYISVTLMMLFFFGILVSSKILRQELPDCVPPGMAFEEGKLTQLDDRTYQLQYVASMWRFDPEVVEIPAGSEVDIYLASKDVVHGFYIERTNVNLMATYGNINYARVRFSKPGTYRVLCHEYCGTGHQNMQAEIIVK